MFEQYETIWNALRQILSKSLQYLRIFGMLILKILNYQVNWWTWNYFEFNFNWWTWYYSDIHFNWLTWNYFDVHFLARAISITSTQVAVSRGTKVHKTCHSPKYSYIRSMYEAASHSRTNIATLSWLGPLIIQTLGAASEWPITRECGHFELTGTHIYYVMKITEQNSPTSLNLSFKLCHVNENGSCT